MRPTIFEQARPAAMRVAVFPDGTIESSVLDGPVKRWASAQECYNWYRHVVDEMWEPALSLRVAEEALCDCWLASLSILSALDDLVSDGTLDSAAHAGGQL